MDKNDDPGNPELGEATKDITTNVAIATVHSQEPSAIFSSKGDSYSSQLHKLQYHISKVLKGLSPSEEVSAGDYNPEIFTTQKRQWASFQRSLDQPVKEPSQLFESIVVVGLHHNVDLLAFKRQLMEADGVGPKKLRNILNHQLGNVADVNIEPQVLFVYPADKELPLPYKDLVSICLPGGVEVRAIERTPSLSELNEIFLGQEQLKKSDLSFVFRLQVADNSTLYGCCVLVEEIVQNPSRLVSILSETKCLRPFLSRHIITTTRCYCILSRLPFFTLHFGVLKSIFAEERLERLTSSVDILNFFSSEENNMQEESQSVLPNHATTKAEVVQEGCDEPTLIPESLDTDESYKQVEEILDFDKAIKYNNKCHLNVEKGVPLTENELSNEIQNGHFVEVDMDMKAKQSQQPAPEAVLQLGQSHEYGSSKHFGRKMRVNIDDPETDGPFSHHEDSNSHVDILQWAKENNHGSLQIICQYYQLPCPARGSKLTFQPLEHLHPLEFHRAHCALLAEEEAMSLSVWTIACACATLRLENILMMFSAALLEKQIVIISSNLGILSASVLSVIPLIRPYQWQSLLMPVLPNDMLDFLDAPVPYIVGIKEISAEFQLKSMNLIIVDANRNMVRSPLMPQLPRYKELLTSLTPYYTKLVGESYLARKRPVYECTDVQVEAATGFLAVFRSYLDSLCSNLRAHTITNVQSNCDKVSLLLKESFIDSFPNRDRPFIKLFVDTQLFSVHTDFILSLYQKD